MKDYAAIATQYARDVVDGRILVCRWVRLAAQRHLNDLDRDAAGGRYTWNPELETAEGKKYRPADRACYFIELLPHIKGDWAARGERIQLQPWQIFIVASIFGWINRETKRRRFRYADLYVPRKNSKSTMAAGIGLYMFAADGEFGSEIYSGATSEDQAYEVFEPAKLMARRTPDLLTRFGITVRESNISIEETNCKFEPVIGKPGDGASPSCAIVDEYHQHVTEYLYDTMKTGMGARSQPLMLVITTAGDDISGPCYAHQEELQQILEGLIDDDQRFGIIFTIDIDEDGKPEDWTTEEALIKANPNYGVSLDGEFLLAALRDAIRDPRKQATFQTKHLNIWVASASPWLPMQAWKAAGDKSLKLEDFRGQQCIEGIDLANTTDIASRCKIFRRTIDAREHWYFFWTHYLPETRIEEPENRHYQGWHKAGWLVATSGSMIDQDRIERDILADDKLYPIREAAFDPWGAPGIIGALQAALGHRPDGEERVLTVPLQARYLSAPMKWIDGLLREGLLHHNGDPVAAWAVSNVTNKPDQNDNWFPRKPASKSKKTDPAVAMIIATARSMVFSPPKGSINDFLRDPVSA
jgi:phage terminase large subunit-like protein